MNANAARILKSQGPAPFTVQLPSGRAGTMYATARGLATQFGAADADTLAELRAYWHDLFNNRANAAELAAIFLAGRQAWADLQAECKACKS